jgi:hypothetical protein
MTATVSILTNAFMGIVVYGGVFWLVAYFFGMGYFRLSPTGAADFAWAVVILGPLAIIGVIVLWCRIQKSHQDANVEYDEEGNRVYWSTKS